MPLPVPPAPPTPIAWSTVSDKDKDLVIEAWKQIVAVQMHFNEIEMTIRNLYFTVLAAAMGLIGVVYDKYAEIPFHSIQISMAMTVLATLPLISYLFYFIDRHWYHRLLQGAVNQGGVIETTYGATFPAIRLGTSISEASVMTIDRGRRWPFGLFVWERQFWNDGELHSGLKIEFLYKSVMVTSAFFALVILIFGGFAWDGHSIIESIFPQSSRIPYL